MFARSRSFTRTLVCMLSPLCVVVANSVPCSADGETATRSAVSDAVGEFFVNNCFDCHHGSGAEAGLDLTKLSVDLSKPGAETRWARVWDRVHSGEMPPADYGELAPKESKPFLDEVGKWIRQHRREQNAELGRVQGRKLTSRELERTLQSLLGIDIPLAALMPEQERSAEFSTIFYSQSMSHHDLQQHLNVVDAALDEAFRRALTPPDRLKRDMDYKEISRRPNRKRTREPEIIGDRAVVWSAGVIFYGRVPATTAPEDGWYRFRINAEAINPPKRGGVWTTVRSGLCVSSAPLLAWVGAFEAQPEMDEYVFETWLPKGHRLEIRPADRRLKRGKFGGGQVGNGEGEPQNISGIAMEGIVMERFHRGPDDDAVRRLILGDLEIEKKGKNYQVKTKTPKADATRLIERFARRAFRRPASSDVTNPYVNLVHSAIDKGDDFLSALRLGYRAILCAPRFLYFTEDPGVLDDYAVATRLSYLLTGDMPDRELTHLAESGRLRSRAAFRQQVERLLQGEGGRRFIRDFAAEWLDLDQIEATEPDPKLINDFDSIVQSAMLDETHAYLETMLRENLSVTHLVKSDFTFLNSRLADFYGIDGVKGGDIRRVALKPEHRRGGVLTHGSVLKVTSNGSNTSPVLRGVWINERILGDAIPSPPENVPAIEPDIRGAQTIREMLAKHRSSDACASCHVKIDPPGFALENYDPAGRWRDRYVAMVNGKRKSGSKVDASYETPDGTPFEDITEFQSIVSAQKRKLAHNVAEKIVVYGTGAPVSFADREVIDRIVDASAAEDYGFRSILNAAVASELFLTK